MAGKPTVKDPNTAAASPASAGPPAQQFKAPEPSPKKSSSKDDEEEEKKQQDNPMDLLKPKKDGKKDEAQRAAGDQMKLVDQLSGTVGEINEQVTDAFKSAATSAKDAVSGKIDKGIQAVRDFVEKDMPTMGVGKGAGPVTPMGAAADASPANPAADVQSRVRADAVATPKETEAPKVPDTDQDPYKTPNMQN